VGAKHPELFLEPLNDGLNQAVGDHIEVLDHRLLRTGSAGRRLNALRNEADRIAILEPLDRERAAVAFFNHVFSTSAREAPQGDDSFGNAIRPQAPLVDEYVEAFMGGLETLTDNSPVCLFPDQVKVGQIHQHRLQCIGHLRCIVSG
jgi:hypothetical protein